MPQPCRGALGELLAAQADDNGRRAGEFLAPIVSLLVVTSNSAGNQPRVGGKILVGAHVDLRRGLRRADQACKLIWRYRCVGLHDCALVKINGTRYLGMSPRGGIAKPP